MDYFTKNKMFFWVIVVLTVLNSVTITSFWLKRSPAHRPNAPQDTRDGRKIMEERLNLSPEQVEKLEQIRQRHFKNTRPLQDDLHKIRLDLIDELFALEPDQTKINNMLSELEKGMGEFENALFTHFQELKSLCDETQAQELKYMLIDLIESTRPRPQQQGQPPHLDSGPNHRPPPRRR
ncbi:MAG: periplasmic heavy metal sensor [Anaerohalosphaera sp.]|nr:periplasmic heavy metal sensor [Anaerohalosphaera sp.]